MSEALVGALDSLTGWTASSGLTLELNLHRDLIAGGRAASVAVRVPAGSAGKYVSLPVTFAARASYDELTLSLASLRSKWAPVLRAADARYSLRTSATGPEHYVPCGPQISRASIPMPAAVDRLTVTVRHDGSDYLVLSNLVACKDGGPEDLLNAVTDAVGVERDRLLGAGIRIGSATGSDGDLGVTISSDWSWVAPGVVLAFEVSTGVYERHQVLSTSDNVVSFNTRYDGAALLADMVNAPVFVTFPVEVGYYDREADLPGVAVWHDPPAPQERHSRAGREVRCIRVGAGGTVAACKREGALVSWRVTLEVAARSPELVGQASRVVRSFLARSELWVHGEKLWFDWKEPPSAIEPVEGFDLVPRATYPFLIEVKEDSWAVEELVPGSPDLSVSLS